MDDQTYIVAGNATSLSDPKGGRILKSDRIVRVNNFYFEPMSFLGRRVDLAVMGGDARVAPFMFETLWRQRHVYDLKAWTSHNPKVVRAGQRRFADRFIPFPITKGKPRIPLEGKVAALMAHYDSKPMTGTYGALCAYNLGANAIILTGFDFHQHSKRYAYDAGSRQMKVLGRDLNSRSIDRKQHNVDLDLAILECIQQKLDGQLMRISSNTLLDTFCDLAPLRDGPRPEVVPTYPPKDWAGHVGAYPLVALRVYRSLRHFIVRR